MSELESVLGEMSRINDRMLMVVHGADDERSRHIMELRQEFTAETGNLIFLLPTEQRLISRPDLFTEFQDRLAAVRRKLDSHQAKWSISDIGDRRDAYLEATASVHDSIADYVDWAREALNPR